MNLTSEHKKELTQALLLLGIDERIIRELFASFRFPMIDEEVKITIANLKTDLPIRIGLTFYKPQGAQRYTLPEYTGTLVLQPEIEHLDINDVNTLRLEQLMSSLDWNYNYLLTYYGGKQTLAPLIVSLIPDFIIYGEPLTGGAAVLLQKPPSKSEVLDLTPEAVISLKILCPNRMFIPQNLLQT